MVKKIDILDSSPMTSAQGARLEKLADRVEKLLLVAVGQQGLLLTTLAKMSPDAGDQKTLKEAAIQMTAELAQIYDFEIRGVQ